ncbi:MAG TPA: DUF4956 domain-containing protein [Acidobacteriota bacterium]|jgi:hypothetical protein
MRSRSWKTLKVVIVSGALCAALVWSALRWPGLLTIPGAPAYLPSPALDTPPPLYPFLEVLKLVVAALLGVMITAVHKHYHREKLLSRSMEQAEILLTVAGALMMIIIGGSLPRAFGVLGAASIIRFRTPIEDPKDTTILFLLLGVGMACGLASFGVAGLATVFICLFLAVLDHIGEQKPRAMMLELVAEGRELPTRHIQNIFAAYGLVYEPREVSHGDGATIKYHVLLEPNTSLEYMSEQLISGGYSGIKSVTWELPKKSN